MGAARKLPEPQDCAPTGLRRWIRDRGALQSDDSPVCSSRLCHHTPAYMFLIYLSRVFLKLLVGKKQFIPVKYMTPGVLEKNYFNSLIIYDKK